MEVRRVLFWISDVIHWLGSLQYVQDGIDNMAKAHPCSRLVGGVRGILVQAKVAYEVLH